MATEMDFLGQQLTRMAVNWRLTNMAATDKARQKQEFKPLLDKWGETRFRVCVDRCIREHATGFFPSIAEFIAFDEGAIGPTNLTVCPMCRDTEGWRFHDYERPSGTVKNAAYRCTHGRIA